MYQKRSQWEGKALHGWQIPFFKCQMKFKRKVTIPNGSFKSRSKTSTNLPRVCGWKLGLLVNIYITARAVFSKVVSEIPRWPILSINAGLVQCHLLVDVACSTMHQKPRGGVTRSQRGTHPRYETPFWLCQCQTLCLWRP